MLDDPEFRIPADFAEWTNYAREDWAFSAQGVSHTEQRWRKRKFAEFNDLHPRAPVVVEERAYRYSYEETQYEESGAPPRCPQESEPRHWREGCPRCIVRRRWATSMADAYAAESAEQGIVDETIWGDQLEALPPTRVLFGSGQLIVSAVGQPWGIFGPDGTGKSTIGEHYSKGRLGIPGWETMWGMPIEPLPDDRTVLYLALDRAVQIMEGMRRGVDFDQHRDQMHRLAMKRNTLHNLGTDNGMAWLSGEVERLSAGLLVIDSRKDVGGTLDAVSIQGINNLVRSLSNDEVEVLILGHTREGRRPNGVGPSVEDPSGFREVVSGLGSVIVLDGSPGAPTTDVHHVKPIHELVPPFRVQNDHVSGRGTVLGPIVAARGGGAKGGMKFQLTGGAAPMSGTVPVNARQNMVLAVIDANQGTARSSDLQAVLNDSNLSRGLRELELAGIVEKNGKRGPQAGYRRGPNAPKA